MNKIEIAELPPETLAFLTRMINETRWQSAKATNYPPELMHSYTMVHFDEKSRNACYALFRAIDKYGFDDDFFGQPHRYLVIGQYKYWHYDTIVNREDVNLHQMRLALDEERKQKKQKENPQGTLF